MLRQWKIRRNGHAENGDQRARCLDRGRTFVLQPEGARYDQRFKDQVAAAHQDRMGIRGITRTFGVCHETVLRWVGEKSGTTPGLRGHASFSKHAENHSDAIHPFVTTYNLAILHKATAR